MDQVKIPQLNRAGVKCGGSPKSTASRPLLLNAGTGDSQSAAHPDTSLSWAEDSGP